MATGKRKRAAKPWPNSVAAKVLASYIRLKFDISAADLMFFNPPMGAMPFFNNSASPDIRHAELPFPGRPRGRSPRTSRSLLARLCRSTPPRCCLRVPRSSR
jgi:hypothetical protein